MALLVILLMFSALALLAPVFGVDSRSRDWSIGAVIAPRRPRRRR